MADAVLPAIGFLPVYFPAQKDTVQVISTRLTRIGGWALYNPNATVAYVLFFNKVGTVTLGVDVPKFVMPLPAGAAANMFVGKHGIYISDGLQIACTTTPLGVTPPVTGLDVAIFYQ